MGLLQKRQLTPFFLNQYHPIMMTFSTRSSPNHFRQGITAGIIAGALWGLVFLFPRLTPEFSPMSQMVLRYVCYGLFALALSFQTLPALMRTLSHHDWGMLVKLSLQANILYYLCLATGVKYGGIAPTTLIIGMLPVTIAVMGRNDAGSLSWRALYAPIGLIVGGIIFISWDLFSHTSETLTSTPIQRLFALLSATGALVLWTYAAVNNARYLRERPDLSPADWSNLTGVVTALLSIGILIIAYLIAQWQPDHIFAINTQADLPWLKFILLGGVVIAFLSSYVGNILWNKASQLLPISLSGQLIMSETLFSLLYGFIYDGRMPRLLEWVAMVLALSGVLWAIKLHAEAHPKDAPPEMH